MNTVSAASYTLQRSLSTVLLYIISTAVSKCSDQQASVVLSWETCVAHILRELVHAFLSRKSIIFETSWLIAMALPACQYAHVAIRLSRRRVSLAEFYVTYKLTVDC